MTAAFGGELPGGEAVLPGRSNSAREDGRARGGVASPANNFQYSHRPLGFINPLYRLAGSRGLHDLAAPSSPLAQVRTDYVNFLDNSQGTFFRLQTIDVQSSTLHDTPDTTMRPGWVPRAGRCSSACSPGTEPGGSREARSPPGTRRGGAGLRVFA